jgi:hypothetical protein
MEVDVNLPTDGKQNTLNQGFFLQFYDIAEVMIIHEII